MNTLGKGQGRGHPLDSTESSPMSPREKDGYFNLNRSYIPPDRQHERRRSIDRSQVRFSSEAGKGRSSGSRDSSLASRDLGAPSGPRMTRTDHTQRPDLQDSRDTRARENFVPAPSVPHAHATSPSSDHANLVKLFEEYGDKIASKVFALIRRDEAKLTVQRRNAEVDKFLSEHASFPSIAEFQLSGRLRAENELAELEAEYNSRSLGVSKVIDLVAEELTRTPNPKQDVNVSLRRLDELEMKAMNRISRIETEFGTMKNQHHTNYKDIGFLKKDTRLDLKEIAELQVAVEKLTGDTEPAKLRAQVEKMSKRSDDIPGLKLEINKVEQDCKAVRKFLEQESALKRQDTATLTTELRKAVQDFTSVSETVDQKLRRFEVVAEEVMGSNGQNKASHSDMIAALREQIAKADAHSVDVNSKIESVQRDMEQIRERLTALELPPKPVAKFDDGPILASIAKLAHQVTALEEKANAANNVCAKELIQLQSACNVLQADQLRTSSRLTQLELPPSTVTKPDEGATKASLLNIFQRIAAVEEKSRLLASSVELIDPSHSRISETATTQQTPDNYQMLTLIKKTIDKLRGDFDGYVADNEAAQDAVSTTFGDLVQGLKQKCENVETSLRHLATNYEREVPNMKKDIFDQRSIYINSQSEIQNLRLQLEDNLQTSFAAPEPYLMGMIAPVVEQKSAVIKDELEKIFKDKLDSHTMGIRNLDSRVCNLTTEHVARSILNHLGTCFPNLSETERAIGSLRASHEEQQRQLHSFDEKFKLLLDRKLEALENDRASAQAIPVAVQRELTIFRNKHAEHNDISQSLLAANNELKKGVDEVKNHNSDLVKDFEKLQYSLEECKTLNKDLEHDVQAIMKQWAADFAALQVNFEDFQKQRAQATTSSDSPGGSASKTGAKRKGEAANGRGPDRLMPKRRREHKTDDRHRSDDDYTDE